METVISGGQKKSVKRNGAMEVKNGYAPVNGLKMYYEIIGSGSVLVYVPPVFGQVGLNYFPALAEKYRVLTMDLQGHGRTEDIEDRPISFEQHAEDIVTLLKHLKIDKADFFGESFGGTIATIIAVRYPEMVRRMATYGATFGKYQESYKPEVLTAQLSRSPDSYGIQFQRENYKSVASDPSYWPKLWVKVLAQNQWQGFTREQLSSIKMPFLIALGDHDFVRLDHALEIFGIIPNAEFAVIPDAGHFVLNDDQERVIPQIEHFLEEPTNKVPYATTETGYHPGKTR
jgi:pimeloyl-ACP methyl ester carboxylesterase